MPDTLTLAEQVEKNAKTLEMTVLHRPGNPWQQVEIDHLYDWFKTDISSHYSSPEHLVLLGHHPKEEVLMVLNLDEASCTVTQVTGMCRPLPFIPSFMLPPGLQL